MEFGRGRGRALHTVSRRLMVGFSAPLSALAVSLTGRVWIIESKQAACADESLNTAASGPPPNNRVSSQQTTSTSRVPFGLIPKLTLRPFSDTPWFLPE